MRPKTAEEGPKESEGMSPGSRDGMSQMFAQAKLARGPARVKPERALAARNPSGRVENKQTQVVRRGNLKRSVLNDSNRPVRTRMPGGVGGVGQVT